MNLDEPQRYGEVDHADALGDVEGAAEQWVRARDLADVRLDSDGVEQVVVAGMGGSGICGDVVRALAEDRLDVPVTVHKGYGLPRFVGPRTLVVAISYSGATEETRAALDEAANRRAQRFVVTSGAKLAGRCAALRTPHVVVPGGLAPRHALGYLLVPVLVALGLDDGLAEAVEVQRRVVKELGRGVATADNGAKQLALRLSGGAVPLLWGGHGIGSVAAYRLRCQLAENAKHPAIHAELPELNHNDVCVWQELGPLHAGSGLVTLRDPVGEPEPVARRFALTAELVDEHLAWRDELTAAGESALARLASLLLQADLVSVYTALALDRDPSPTPLLERLKTGMRG